jgi:hypothetical protein
MVPTRDWACQDSLPPGVCLAHRICRRFVLLKRQGRRRATRQGRRVRSRGRCGTCTTRVTCRACLNRLHWMGPGFSNREANVNPTVVNQGKAVATETTDDAAHAAHEVYEAPPRACPRTPRSTQPPGVLAEPTVPEPKMPSARSGWPRPAVGYASKAGIRPPLSFDGLLGRSRRLAVHRWHHGNGGRRDGRAAMARRAVRHDRFGSTATTSRSHKINLTKRD